MHLADIIGLGQTKTAEHWNRGLIDLAVEAGGTALDQSRCRPTAVIMSNALGGPLGDQRNLAAYVATQLGLCPVEAATIDTDEASGGSAFRLALALLGANLHEQVLVIGAEKATDALPDNLDAARSAGLDVQQEAGFGIGPSVAAALVMQRYIEEYQLDRDDFYHISRIAHANGAKNRMGFFPWRLSREQYLNSPLVAEPVTICDTAPPCDGAAAVVVRRSTQTPNGCVKITGSSAVSFASGISLPSSQLALPASRHSAKHAMAQAGVTLEDISLFELHDSSSIIGALSLEALGLAEPGQALRVASGDQLTIDGAHPTWTFGGHKARGNPIGAAGVYQIVEAAMQLLGEAGDNQVKDAKHALAQCLGSFGSTAVTHVLSR